ncbi:MAG TPA: tetratricopeptide repeat protein, partial [Rhizomicrobium sp.]|nr:tetratricopeptide repeat protein [Rhizomicrobium sp.]
TTRRPNFDGHFVYFEAFPRTTSFNEVRETITAPKSFPLYVESHEVEAGKKEDGANVTYTWHYSAPKPVTDEPETFAPLEHMPRFIVSSFKDYVQMGRAYAALAEPKRVVSPRIRALAEEITAGTSDPRAQVQKLYEWVSTHIRYVAIELGTGSFVPHDVDAIVVNGYGDCKDHDILLQALLKAKGIDAHSILINSDSNYTLTEVPTFVALDHVITFVPQFDLYLDSSVGLAPFGVLPLQQYGKPMVVASASSARLGKMPLLAPGTAKITLKTVAALDKSGEVTGTTTTTASGPYAIILRLLGLQIQGTGPTAATRLLTAMGYENASGTFTLGDPKGFAPDYAISATFKWTGWADYVAGKNSFFMPPALRLLGRTGEGAMGPFDPGSMAPGEPTVCLSTEQSEDLSLKAPPGIQFDGVPKDVRVETPNLLFTAHWSLAGDTLSVRRAFTSKIDQPLCTGTIRTQSAEALKKISDSYDVAVAFVEAGSVAAITRPLHESALAHSKAGQYDLAIADYSKIIEQTPNDRLAYSNRGAVFIKSRKYDLAIADFTKSIALNGEFYEPYFNRGLAQVGTHQFTAAIADFDKAISLKPDDARLYKERGRARLGVRQYALTIADFDKAIALAPDDFESYMMRAGANLSFENYAPAISDLTKALSLRPGDMECLDARAYARFQAKEYKLAIADYDAVIAQRPNMSSAYLYRGDAKLKLGRKAEGDADIATAVKLDPSLK